MHWICHDGSATCLAAALCDGCLSRHLVVARRQANVTGQCWAERVARDPAHRPLEWPTGDPKTLEIARRLVASLAPDPRLVEPLAVACDAGAAAWWARQPGAVQVTWSLVTSPDERERCCAVVDGVRCEQPTAFLVASADGAWDDYAYVCGDHVRLVSGPGYVVERL